MVPAPRSLVPPLFVTSCSPCPAAPWGKGINTVPRACYVSQRGGSSARGGAAGWVPRALLPPRAMSPGSKLLRRGQLQRRGWEDESTGGFATSGEVTRGCPHAAWLGTADALRFCSWARRQKEANLQSAAPLLVTSSEGDAGSCRRAPAGLLPALCLCLWPPCSSWMAAGDSDIHLFPLLCPERAPATCAGLAGPAAHPGTQPRECIRFQDPVVLNPAGALL